MALVSQIITDAYQYNNIVALSAIPNAEEQAKALRYLNRIFKSIFGNEVGEPLQVQTLGALPTVQECDVYSDALKAPYILAHNPLLVCRLTGPQTVYLPSQPSDGERLQVQDITGVFGVSSLTVNGNGRTIEGALSLVLNTPNLRREWFFRADLGDWVRVSGLLLTDVFPLPEEFEEYFITMLALRLGASEDIDLNSQLQFVLKDVLKKFRARYKQKHSINSEAGLVRTVWNNR